MTTFSFLTHPSEVQINQLLQLYETAGWWTPDAEAPAELLQIISGSHCFLVAESKGEIVGMGRAISDGVSDGYIQDVAVRPEVEGRGIGSQIVTRIAKRLKTDGLTWVGLIAERNSHTFYRRIGFSPLPDAVPMRLEIK